MSILKTCLIIFVIGLIGIIIFLLYEYEKNDALSLVRADTSLFECYQNDSVLYDVLSLKADDSWELIPVGGNKWKDKFANYTYNTNYSSRELELYSKLNGKYVQDLEKNIAYFVIYDSVLGTHENSRLL